MSKEQEMYAHVGSWEQSGKSQKVFCRAAWPVAVQIWILGPQEEEKPYRGRGGFIRIDGRRPCCRDKEVYVRIC